MAKIDLTAVVFVLSYLLYQIGAPPHQTSGICHNYPYEVDSIFWLLKTTISSCIVLFYRRAKLRCFWLLAFISRPQVRNIHLPGQMNLPGSLIPSDKYFLKNLTFVVRNPLVWLRHHSSQTLYVAKVKSKQGHCFLVVCIILPWSQSRHHPAFICYIFSCFI